MTVLRHHLLRHRALAVWLVAMALAMRILVPSGYMIGSAHGAFAVQLCPGSASQAMAMPGGQHHSGDQDHGKPDQPCAFAGLASPSLAGADVLLLAEAIAFVIRTGHQPRVEPARAVSRPHLRPPLRGPPQTI